MTYPGRSAANLEPSPSPCENVFTLWPRPVRRAPNVKRPGSRVITLGDDGSNYFKQGVAGDRVDLLLTRTRPAPPPLGIGLFISEQKYSENRVFSLTLLAAPNILIVIRLAGWPRFLSDRLPLGNSHLSNPTIHMAKLCRGRSLRQWHARSPTLVNSARDGRGQPPGRRIRSSRLGRVVVTA